jgi:hypothetical protein
MIKHQSSVTHKKLTQDDLIDHRTMPIKYEPMRL